MSDSYSRKIQNVIKVENTKGVMIVTLLAREITMFILAEVRATLNEAILEKPEILILDVSQTSYLDSSGIAVIFRLRHQVLSYNGRFCIAGLKGRLLTILEKILAKDDIHFYASMEEALETEVPNQTG